MKTVVAVLLIVLEPLRLAGELLSVVGTIAYRGWLAPVELVVHAAIAALCATGGFALLNEGPDARRLARIGIVASFARVVQSTWWSALPSNMVPGDELLTVGFAAVVAAVAFVIASR